MCSENADVDSNARSLKLLADAITVRFVLLLPAAGDETMQPAGVSLWLRNPEASS
jgi:hypothetical protein